MPDTFSAHGSSAEYLTTSRLSLAPLGAADLAEVHGLYADPGTWLHLPAGRHSSLDQTERLIADSERSWTVSGLGRWSIRARTGLPGLPDGAFIGVVSATLLDCGVRNFGYRLTPASWGMGLATEAATAALAEARSSVYPVTARALANNPASVRVLERIGLIRVWSGHGTGSASAAPSWNGRPDTTALHRVIFADRPLAPDLLAEVIRLG